MLVLLTRRVNCSIPISPLIEAILKFYLNFYVYLHPFLIDDKIYWCRHGRKKFAKMLKEWFFKLVRIHRVRFTLMETFLDRTFTMARFVWSLILGFTVSYFFRVTRNWPKQGMVSPSFGHFAKLIKYKRTKKYFQVVSLNGKI